MVDGGEVMTQVVPTSYHAAYYQRNRAAILVVRRKHYAKNREQMKAANKKRWLKKSREERKILHRQRQVKHLYKLAADEHESILVKQDYKCPITGDPVDIYSAIDHDRNCCSGDRSCGKCIRGILSHRMNAALGMFENDPERLLRAYSYLRKGK